jgi:hypothetical protein
MQRPGTPHLIFFSYFPGYLFEPIWYAMFHCVGCLRNTYEARFGELDGYNEEHTSIKLLALSICQSIVSLASFKGNNTMLL